MVCTAGRSCANSRNTSIPGTPGIAMSRRRMSGLSSRVRATASFPSVASATTTKSSWVTSNRRRPSRKIAWSSAIRIRIGRVVILCDGMQFLLGDFDFQPRATARPGIDREFSTDGAHALVDDQGTLMSTLQIRMRKPATELKAATIIINRENPISFLRTKPNQNIVCTAMPGHIHQRFLDDAGDLATDMWGKGHIAKITDKLGGNACIGSVALDHAGKKIDQMPGIEIQRFELLNQCSDIGSFVLHQLLYVEKLPIAFEGIHCRLSAQSIQTESNRVQRLNYTVVQVARHSRPFCRCRTGTQPAQ